MPIEDILKKMNQRERRQRIMFDMITRWQESGQSQKDFMTKHNIKPWVFYPWLKRYREQHNSPRAGFTTIEVTPEVRPHGNGAIIHFPRGVRLEVLAGTSAAWVRQVMGL